MKFKVQVILGNITEDLEVDVDASRALDKAAYDAAYIEFRKKYPAYEKSKAGLRKYGGAPSLVITERDVK